MENIEISRALWLNEKEGLLLINKNGEWDALPTDFACLNLNGIPQKLRFSATTVLEVAAMIGYGEEKGEIIFLSPRRDPKSEQSEDLYLAGDLNQWLSTGLDPQWQLKPETIQNRIYNVLRIPKDKLPPHFQFKFVSQQWVWQPLPRFSPNKIIAHPCFENLEYRAESTGKHIIKFFLEDRSFHFNDHAEVVQRHRIIAVDDAPWLFSLYSCEKLGAYVDDHGTHFALFAPKISSAEVLWKENLDGAYQEQRMVRQTNGIWTATIQKNLTHSYYLLRIQKMENGLPTTRDIVDPYAKALVNKNGPGIIVETLETVEHFQAPPIEQWVIYEGHVRDLIANVAEISEAEKLGFSGLVKFLERGYFQSLGINALELQPIQEFDNDKKEDYHWGYMPVNYFAPASAYAHHPEKGTQVQEFRELVEALHRQKIAVILDVVYNHSGEPNALSAIDPKYFFRQNDAGYLLNYSGCGNDLYTENPMVRKLIMDSLEHWVRVYDVDGFRFDLAELVGLEFLDEVRVHLQTIKPSIAMIAEPWSFRSYAGHEVRRTKLLAWNDEYREFIRDYILGYGNSEGLSYFVEGSLKFRSQFPAQSVNYLSSHDDFCWIDRITENVHHDGFIPTLVDVRRTHMALAILLLSLGTPMLGQGMELLHSKRGVHNTYQRGDLNALDYGRILEYPLTIKYVQPLIDLRRRSSLFCLNNVPSSGYIRLINSKEKNAAATLLFNATQENGPMQILLALNPYFQKAHFNLSALKNMKFSQIADTFSFQNKFDRPYLWNGDELELPPLSCGLFIRCNERALEFCPKSYKEPLTS
ncbi:MAG: hypothetical protein LBB11_01555 [Puniceicoccales bacterium]|jgi:pullulanase/glycogen debranching enzyme|nr:hypothetical protein [Puniceicoccales bacterium]